MKTLVFADVHLKVDEANRDTLDDFVAFLRTIDPAEFPRIVIVGDLFDFWYEYRHVIYSGYFDVLRVFADLRDAGVEFHLICGNHDFWAGRFFEKQLGFHVHRDAFDCTIGTRRVRFVHGDGVNPADVGYNFYKRIARIQFMIAGFRLVHPDWAMALAQRLSRASRRRNSPKERRLSPEIRAIREFARGLLESGEVDAVVCGHTHTAAYEEFDTPRGRSLYINTGGWLDDRAYWIWEEDSVTRYAGPLTDRRRAPIDLPEEGKRVPARSIHVPAEEPDQA